jgi:hypothetical protein
MAKAVDRFVELFGNKDISIIRCKRTEIHTVSFSCSSWIPLAG